MSTDSQRWRACAWLRSLAFQWHKARGHAASSFQRPFSRDWEDLLQESNLISAESRTDSFSSISGTWMLVVWKSPRKQHPSPEASPCHLLSRTSGATGSAQAR